MGKGRRETAFFLSVCVSEQYGPAESWISPLPDRAASRLPGQFERRMEMNNRSGFNKVRTWCTAAVLAAVTVAAGCGSGDEIFGTTPPTSSSGPLSSGGAGANPPLAINLGVAVTYGIASRAGLSSTGVTVVNGDVALFPTGTCTDATGAPANCQVENKPPSALGLTVNGVIRHPTDSDAGATATAVTTALTAAWVEGMAFANTQPAIAADELGGKTFVPGIYENANLTLAIGSVATMDAQNNPNAVFIFKVTLGGDITDSGTIGNPSRIALINGAQARNVWFLSGRDIIVGGGTVWNGHILANRTATVNGTSTVNGRVLAGAGGAGAVTLTGVALTPTTINVLQ
jgi:Ice-binding-like